ncbi:hypothetical protein Ancab_035079 [Ancistrocladus abbreviatus]
MPLQRMSMPSPVASLMSPKKRVMPLHVPLASPTIAISEPPKPPPLLKRVLEVVVLGLIVMACRQREVSSILQVQMLGVLQEVWSNPITPRQLERDSISAVCLCAEIAVACPLPCLIVARSEPLPGLLVTKLAWEVVILGFNSWSSKNEAC